MNGPGVLYTLIFLMIVFWSGNYIVGKIALRERPAWFDLRQAPRHNFAWFIWDWQHAGPVAITYALTRPSRNQTG